MAFINPVNQKRLTNICLVKLRKGGKRFEIACYPNKVQPWRDGLETDLQEVLQMDKVFINVSKGELAKDQDLKSVFGTTNHVEICKKILVDGELQHTSKERQVSQQSLVKEVAKIISDKCINPTNNRCYTPQMIERLMQEMSINLNPKKSAKSQALHVIRQLKASGNVSIDRVTMTIRFSVDAKFKAELYEPIIAMAQKVLHDGSKGKHSLELELVVEPGVYHKVEEMLQSVGKGKYTLEIVDFVSDKLEDEPRTSAAGEQPKSECDAVDQDSQ